MKFRGYKQLIIGLCMFIAAGMALALKPAAKLIDREAQLNLETLIPAKVGNWKIDQTIAMLISPDQKAALENVYNQTLSRTYVNSAGNRIMLSVAYGGTHGEGMQLHRPENCYPAQGFQVVKDTQTVILPTQYGNLPIKRLVAAQGARNEPITYWAVVGNQHTQFGWRMKVAQMRYTLTGVVPDGMLVRVSSIGSDEASAYEDQTDFIRALLTTMNDSERERITGKFDS